jgi:hypothetical protein
MRAIFVRLVGHFWPAGHGLGTADLGYDKDFSHLISRHHRLQRDKNKVTFVLFTGKVCFTVIFR